MRRAERIVLALGALGEAGEAAAHAQRADAVAPAGQDLVRIGLMPDVPHDAVARRIEQVMQRDGQLDHAEARAEMPAGDRDGVDRLLTQFVRQTGAADFRRGGAGRRGYELGRAGAFLNRTRVSPRIRPAFKGPERRNIYRALHHNGRESANQT
jgi:hypothetical protein